jgi:hypothetical protein
MYISVVLAVPKLGKEFEIYYYYCKYAYSIINHTQKATCKHTPGN